MTNNFTKASVESQQPRLYPRPVLDRLPLYIRVLGQMQAAGVKVVLSRQLAPYIRITAGQVRKDLSYFGQFGKSGGGYNTNRLIMELRSIVGLNRQWGIVLVGAGRLGNAIMADPGIPASEFQIVAAFDADPSVVGSRCMGLKIRPIGEMSRVVARLHLRIAIVAVPRPVAQGVFDALVEVGITGFLNYVPFVPTVPRNVQVRSIDPLLALQSLPRHLKLD